MAGILKNIRFKSVRARILSVEHISRVLIEWDLEPTTQNLINLRFFIDRGESPSELAQLNGEGLRASGLREYLDLTGHLLDLHKQYVYRVRAVEYQGTKAVQEFASPTFTWDGDLDLTGLYIVEEHLFLHRFVSGVPAMIFKKRQEGDRCPVCWDPVLKRVTRSTCDTCYGTGRLGGFYPPIDVWMSFEPTAEQEVVQDWGRRQVNQTDVQFTNYPLLRIDDVILELKTHKFWKVTNVRAPEKNRVPMLQVARLDAISTSDVEQQLEVPEARRKTMLADFEKRRLEAEF